MADKSPKHLVDLFESIIPHDADIERKQLFGYPTCFIKGNMFASLKGSKLILRLDDKSRSAFFAVPGTSVYEALPGRPMKEYGVAAESMLGDSSKLKDWVSKSVSYARTLPLKEKKPRKTTAVKAKAKKTV